MGDRKVAADLNVRVWIAYAGSVRGRSERDGPDAVGSVRREGRPIHRRPADRGDVEVARVAEQSVGEWRRSQKRNPRPGAGLPKRQLTSRRVRGAEIDRGKRRRKTVACQ